MLMLFLDNFSDSAAFFHSFSFYYSLFFCLAIKCSSPEHPFFRGHGRSLLGGRRHSFRDYDHNDVNASRYVVFSILIWLENKQDSQFTIF